MPVAPLLSAPTPVRQPLTTSSPLVLGGQPATDHMPPVSSVAEATFSNLMQYGLQSLGAGLVDTMLQSVNLADDDDVENVLKSTFGPGGLGDHYSANKANYRIGGEIVGLLIPGMIGLKVIKTARVLREGLAGAGKFSSWLKNSAAVDTLLGNTQTLAKAEQAIAMSAAKEAKSFGGIAGRVFTVPERTAYFKARGVESLRQSIAFEAAFRPLFNDSELFFPADYSVSDEVKWFGVGAVANAAIDYAMGRYAVRRIIQGVASTYDQTLQAANKLDQVVTRPGERGVAITQYAAVRKEAGMWLANSDDEVFRANLTREIPVYDSQLSKMFDQVAFDPHPVFPQYHLEGLQAADSASGGGFKLTNTLLLHEAAMKNEALFVNATKFSPVPKQSPAEVLSQFDERIATLDKRISALRSALGKARFEHTKAKYTAAITKNEPKLEDLKKARDQLASEYHFVVENNGELTAYLNRAKNWLDDHSMDKDIRYQRDKTLGGFASVTTDETGTIKVSDNFLIQMENQKSISHSAKYAIGSRMISRWDPKTAPKEFVLNEKLDFTQVEMTLELARRNPEAAKRIVWDGEFANFRDAEFYVLDEKIQSLMRGLESAEREPLNPVLRAQWARNKKTPAQVFADHNLPMTIDGVQEHPIVKVVAAMKAQGHTSLKDFLVKPGAKDHPLDLLQGALKDALGITEPTGKTISIDAGLLRQRDVRPVLVSGKAVPWISHNTAKLHALIEDQMQRSLENLAKVDPTKAPIVAGVANLVARIDATKQAKNISHVHEGVLSGRGVVVGQDRINEQIDVFKAAQLVAQISDKFIEQKVGELAKQRLTPIVALLKKPNNHALLIDANRIEHSYRSGWDISHVDYSEPTARFVLDKTSETNQRLMRQHFNMDINRESADLLFMPDMVIARNQRQYVPLRAQKQSAEAMEEFSRLSAMSGDEVNALRHAVGSKPIQLRKFHLPTPELHRSGTYFVRNNVGKVVETFTGPNVRNNKERAIEAARRYNLDFPAEKHSVASIEDVRRYHNAFDDAFFDVIDFSDQLRKTGAGIQGGLARREVDTTTQTIEEMASTLMEQFLNVGARARAAMFEPQLNYARAAAQLAPENKLHEHSVWDRYQAIIFNKSPSQRGLWTRERTNIQGIYGGVEGVFDSMLSTAYAHTIERLGLSGMSHAKQMRQIIRKDISENEFREYQKIAEAYSPFRTTEEYLESTYRERTPWALRSASARLATISSSLSLRILDAGTMFLNVLGVYATAPAVIRALRKLPNETDDAWLKRTAAWSSNYHGNIKTFSPNKAFVRAQHAFWSGETADAMKRAGDMGMFEPEYAALRKALSDPIAGGKGNLERFVDWSSKMADNSEIWSRKMAWSMGYTMGKDLHQFTDEKNLFIFANNFMNEMIGNYAPRNKPGMFQGAIGLPLGAFQTYMFNYYRRLFGYIERGDVRSAAAQYATQASMFGAGSVPGWNLFNKMMFDNYDGSDNLHTRLDRKLSPEVADMVMHGSLASIPKIFGAEGGIAVYARASTDMVQLPPNLLEISRAPPLQFLWNTAQGVRKTISNVMQGSNFSLQEQEEILANYATNRAIKSAMELAADAKVDRRGQVVEYGTRDALSVAARVAGFSTTAELQMRDAYNRQQVVEFTQASARAKLNDRTRARIRGGEFGIEDLQDIVHEYTRTGGNPAYFAQWLENIADTSMTPKATRKLDELAGSEKWLEFTNMLAAMQQR